MALAEADGSCVLRASDELITGSKRKQTPEMTCRAATRRDRSQTSRQAEDKTPAEDRPGQREDRETAGMRICFTLASPSTGIKLLLLPMR